MMNNYQTTTYAYITKIVAAKSVHGIKRMADTIMYKNGKALVKHHE